MNILLTSAGRRTYLINYFKQALGDRGKVFASNSILTYSLTQADGYVVTPQIYDDDYINFLISFCKDNDISAILSLFDIDLPILAAAKEKFAKNGITVVVSDPSVIAICNDKWKTYQFLLNCGLQTPRTFIDVREAKDALKKGDFTYPLIIKPRWGMGSIGIIRIENDAELDVLYNKLKRQIFSTYLKFESTEDTEHCILIQECLDGYEYGLDVLNDLNGNYVTTIAKQKIAMRSGETDIAKIVDSEVFESLGNTISDNLHHVANLDIDCFKTKDDEVYVLELNCRFGGQYPFSHLAGVNFPKQIIKWLEGGKSEKKYFTPIIGTTVSKDILPVIFSN